MKGRHVFGVLLMLLGVYMLFNRGEIDGVGTMFALFWPSMFVIPLGLFFHWMYFSLLDRRGVGVLVPGGILLTTGIVFQVATLVDGWSYMWPGCIFAVAVGLFELYWFGGRHKGLLIPIAILTAVSLLFFVVFSVGTLLTHASIAWPIVPIAIMILGIAMLFGRKSNV
ncbi:hypothetical protein [Numidum massiliense]|uniref:hypothetical protein n=1 Tax=Numidum massiliense TaxID=1522315 RepID=UPI0006D534C6|nr:hypothetical protein [Numidum massiliense]